MPSNEWLLARSPMVSSASSVSFDSAHYALEPSSCTTSLPEHPPIIAAMRVAEPLDISAQVSACACATACVCPPRASSSSRRAAIAGRKRRGRDCGDQLLYAGERRAVANGRLGGTQHGRAGACVRRAHACAHILIFAPPPPQQPQSAKERAARKRARDKARIEELTEELDLLKQARQEDTDRFKKTLFDIVNFANTKNYTEVANYTIDIIASIR